MTSGAKVVIVMFAAVIAIALFVVAAFLLTNKPAVKCVEGEMQDNAVRPDGSVLPRVETFSTLDEAESFICRRIPHPRNTGDFVLKEVRVARKLSLGRTIEGEGGADIEIDYAPEGQETPSFSFGAFFPPIPLPSGAHETISLQGVDALLARAGDAAATVQWNKGSWTFTAGAEFDDQLSLDDLLRILETVR
jgi:hypothetical protein